MTDTIMADNKHILQVVKGMCDLINESNSSNAKLAALESYVTGLDSTDHDIVSWVLEQVYSPYIKFGVTSTNIKKLEGKFPIREARPIETVLREMAAGTLTGHEACHTILDIVTDTPVDLVPTIYNIIDKNLKIRMDAKTINKVWTKMYGSELISVFEVSLCNVYAERKHKVNFNDLWLASRKLDGCRLITQIRPDGIKFFSRQGKEFTTLDSLKDSLERNIMDYAITKEFLNARGGMVLDGEICIVDDEGNEDFKAIMKEITRKNHTIDRPMFKVCDLMPLEDFERRETEMSFSDRSALLKDLVTRYRQNIDVENKVRIAEDPELPTEPFMMEWVEQVPVRDEAHFEELFRKAKDLNWEGLVIRKDDTVICKRSDSMLKVKAFQDAEYVVEDVEMGPFRVIVNSLEVTEEVMTTAYITHKGTKVGVGSGWSLEQRRRYKEHPEELVGKTITVQYFEETTDKDGNVSLRFPTCKYVYEDGRQV